MDRKQHQRNATENPDFQRSLITAIHEASPDGILVVDSRDIIVSHNRRLFEVLGMSPAELPGAAAGSLVGLPDGPLLEHVVGMVADREGFLRQVKALYADPQIEDHCEVVLKDGRTLERYSTALEDEVSGYLGRVWFFRDITVRKEVERALQQMSLCDPLTGVANRRHFFERATEEYDRARRYGRHLSFIMLDIDWFKQVNDRWGHAAGDSVLKAVCRCAHGVLRHIDMFARIGGEEFALLAPDTDIDGAFLVAERLRQHVAAQRIAEGSDTIGVTISLGVATLTAKDGSVDDVLKRADAALYAAKRAGRDRTLRAEEQAPG